MKSNFTEISAGSIYRSPAGVEEEAVNPRCARLAGGGVVCSFILQSKLGVNDFRPMLAFSKDGGKSWGDSRPIWPHLADKLSCIGQVSAIPGTNSLLYYGVGFPVEEKGEIYWREDIRGLKQNQLIWARSDDVGETWTDPMKLALPHDGSAEAQGPILVTGDGTWLACYAPYRNWDPDGHFELNCLMQLRSSDEGKSWSFQRIMTFEELQSGAAEAWLAEFSDKLLVATCWHTNLAETGGDFTNKYAISQDGGLSWSGPKDTLRQGQSTSLLTINPQRVLFVYNQRKEKPPGIRAAFFEARDGTVTILDDQLLWAAESGTRSNSAGDHADWTDFSFGEPAMLRLEDQRYLLVFWEKDGSGRSAISWRILGSEGAGLSSQT